MGEHLVALDDVLGEIGQVVLHIRAVLGGLNYERVKQHIQADTVFTLTARANGRMTLDDPLTGTAINLGAFGAANRAVFLKFLPTSGQAS